MPKNTSRPSNETFDGPKRNRSILVKTLRIKKWTIISNIVLCGFNGIVRSFEHGETRHVVHKDVNNENKKLCVYDKLQ